MIRGTELNKILFVSGTKKGGVGKTLELATLAGAAVARGIPVQIVDMDPGNKSISRITEFAPFCTQVDITVDGCTTQRGIDPVIDIALSSPPNSIIIVDAGGAGAAPFLAKIDDEKLSKRLNKAGILPVWLAMVAGGKSILPHCLDQLGELLVSGVAQVDAPVHVLLSPYESLLPWTAEQFAALENTRAFGAKMLGITEWWHLRADTQAQDFVAFRELEMSLARFVAMSEQITDGTADSGTRDAIGPTFEGATARWRMESLAADYVQSMSELIDLAFERARELSQ